MKNEELMQKLKQALKRRVIPMNHLSDEKDRVVTLSCISKDGVISYGWNWRQDVGGDREYPYRITMDIKPALFPFCPYCSRRGVWVIRESDCDHCIEKTFLCGVCSKTYTNTDIEYSEEKIDDWDLWLFTRAILWARKEIKKLEALPK